MSHFTALAVKNRRITLFLAAILTILSLYTYYIIPKQDNPDVSPSVAMVTAIYPGASAEDVQQLVTSKLEDKIKEIKDYDKVVAYSKNSVSIAIVYLKNDGDVDKSWNELFNKMNEVKAALPDEVNEVKVNTSLADTAGIIISFSGTHYSYEQLASYAENIKDELTKIDGVSRFEVNGILDKEITVTLDTAKMNQLSISLDEIVQILSIQNMEIPAGSLQTATSKINVNVPGSYKSIQDIQNTIINVSKENGSVIRLGDISKVALELEEGNLKYKKNGKNTVLLTGYFDPHKNIVLIGKELRNALEDLKATVPADIVIDEVLFQPEDISRAVSSFMISLIQGVVFVLLVVFIGMGLRNALVVSTAIPLSIVITFLGMGIMNIKVHQISTAALIIALGMLVDNAIVVSDAIQYLIDEGHDKFYCCIEGAKKSMVPIFTSTLTTAAAFIPLLLLPGMVGEFVFSLPMVVIIALSASFFIAMIITPTLAYIFFKPTTKKRVLLERIYPIFNKLLLWGLKKKKTILALSFGSLLITAWVAYNLGLQFFPYIDKNVLYIDVQCETVGNIEETERVTEQIEEILMNQPEIIDYTTSIGGGLPKFYLTVPPAIPSTEQGQILVELNLKKDTRFKSNEKFANHLQELLEKNIVGGVATVKLLEYAEPIGAPVVIRVSGEDLSKVIGVSEDLQSQIRTIPGTINVRDDTPRKSYEYIVEIDSDIALRHGITKLDVQRQVNIALMGAKATTFRKGSSESDIIVKSDISSKSQLENLSIKSSVAGNKVLLKQIATITLAPQTDTLTTYNKDITVTVYSDVKDSYSSVDIQNIIEKQKLALIDTHDVTITFDGEREQIYDKFGNIGISAIFAILAIYVILLFQFKSFAKPMIILITLPLSLVGSSIGLYIFNQPLSFMAFLGIVSLFGIVVNNAILLIQYINEAQNNGQSTEKACIDAVNKRFRPIILTTTTTVIGLIPLVLSGSPMFTPMAVALMSGLMVSTILTLVIIPVTYVLLE